MRTLTLRSHRLLGLVATIEGLALWVVAIFLSSYTETGWITLPGVSMATTTLETMHGWLTTPGIGIIEAMAYLGIFIAIIGPVWFWLVRPAIVRLRHWWSATIWIGPGSEFYAGTRDTEAAVSDGHSSQLPEAATESSVGLSDWETQWFEPNQSREFQTVEEALAHGDFLRGASDRDENATENHQQAAEWNFGDPSS